MRVPPPTRVTDIHSPWEQVAYLPYGTPTMPKPPDFGCIIAHMPRGDIETILRDNGDSTELRKELTISPPDVMVTPPRKKKLTPEHKAALQAGRIAAKARRDGMSAQDRAKEVMDRHFERLMQEFIDACLGQKKFKGLDKRTQAALLVKAMEWNIGRPNTGKPIVEPKPEPEKIGIQFE